MHMEEVRSVADALRRRRSEITQTTLTRVRSLCDPDAKPNPEYAEGLKEAVSVALAYGIDALARSDDRPEPIPTLLLSQARLAARNRVRLDVVLRRYCAGYALLGDFVVEEAERSAGLRGAPLKQLLRKQAVVLDRLLAAVSEEYTREVESSPGSLDQRRAERVKRILSGEMVDTTELSYDFEGWHLGLATQDIAGLESVEEAGKALGCRVLLVRREDGTGWAWFGSRRRPDPEEALKIASTLTSGGGSMTIGEPSEGLTGWRLTHRQAVAALSVARRRGCAVARYGEVALIASLAQDELLVDSLQELYLAPLEKERDGGASAMQTLSAYFAAERNISSAAAMLKVSRQTVGSRLRAIEDRIGKPLNSCAAEMEAALLIST